MLLYVLIMNTAGRECSWQHVQLSFQFAKILLITDFWKYFLFNYIFIYNNKH